MPAHIYLTSRNDKEWMTGKGNTQQKIKFLKLKVRISYICRLKRQPSTFHDKTKTKKNLSCFVFQKSKALRGTLRTLDVARMSRGKSFEERFSLRWAESTVLGRGRGGKSWKEKKHGKSDKNKMQQTPGRDPVPCLLGRTLGSRKDMAGSLQVPSVAQK